MTNTILVSATPRYFAELLQLIHQLDYQPPQVVIEVMVAEVDLNNSDMDLCEFKGKTIIMYSWGNQQGTEFLGEAVYEGSLESFLKGFFP